MQNPVIEYKGSYKTGSELKRVIISHFDEGEHLIGRYEVWATAGVVRKKYGDNGLNENDQLENFVIEAFENLLKFNEDNNTKHTGVFYEIGKPPKYGDSKEFPGVLDGIDPIVRTNISLPQSLLDDLKLKAIKESISISELVRRAVTENGTTK